MSKQINFITWEQAANMQQTIPVAEEYKAMLMQVIQYFTKNTFAQFTNMEVFMNAIDLHKYYHMKDYSKMLFEKTQALFDEMQEIEADLGPVMNDIRTLAAKLSERATQG